MPAQYRRNLLILLALAVSALAAYPASALVVGSTDTSEFSNPGSPWYGMNWNYVYATGGGTSVAVGHYSLLTAAHYFIPVGAQLTINGSVFEITGFEYPPNDPGQTLPPDLKVIKLRNTTGSNPLPDFYDVYTGGLGAGRDLILAGTGYTGTSYGSYYTYDTGTPRIERWGTQDFVSSIRKEVDGADSGTSPDWSTLTMRMDYNAASMPHEVGLALSDSGCGIFAKDSASGEWQVAGLGLYVYDNGVGGHWDENYGAMLSMYASWLSTVTDDAYPGDFNKDGSVDIADYTTWADHFGMTGTAGEVPGDGNRNGLVDIADYTVWADRFGQVDPHLINAMMAGGDPLGGAVAGSPVPEPATLAMLLGATLLLPRRKA